MLLYFHPGSLRESSILFSLHPSAVNLIPLPQISAFTLQQDVPPLQPLSVRALHPPPLSVSFQGIGVHPLLPSAMHAYDPMLW